MKKIIYTAVILVSSLSFFTSCTDEDVNPKTELDNGGGAGAEEMKK